MIVPNIILRSCSQYFHKYEFTSSKLFLKELISVTPEAFNKKKSNILIEMCQLNALHICTSISMRALE